MYTPEMGCFGEIKNLNYGPQKNRMQENTRGFDCDLLMLSIV